MQTRRTGTRSVTQRFFPAPFMGKRDVGFILLLIMMAISPVLSQPEDTNDKSFPYTGRITNSNVNIRSGKGTHFYECGMLQIGDKVEVVEERDDWSKIKPPPTCFSWISMQFVAINMDNPSLAVVTGDNVAVYAGSDFVEPLYSISRQVNLKRGTTIKLLNEEKDGFFKIEPPEGSFVWVNSLFIEKVATPVEPVIPQNSIAVVNVVGPNEPDANDVNVVTVEPSSTPISQSDQLKAYYILQEKTKAELAKPLMEQDYSKIVEELKVLAADKQSGDVQRYAQYLLTRIEGYTLAQEVSKAVKKQDEDLSNLRATIKKTSAQRKQGVTNLGRFAVVGVFQTSNIYNSVQVQRFRIMGKTGTTIYAEAAGPLLDQDLKSYVGKKVGLVGKLKPFPGVNGVLVEFTAIEVLE